MRNQVNIDKIIVWTVPIVAAVVIALGTVMTTPQGASASASIAKRTGQPCAKCHSAPPTLNAYGKKYQAKHKK